MIKQHATCKYLYAKCLSSERNNFLHQGGGSEAKYFSRDFIKQR